ncbi:hypothetical protein ETB97_000501 [Aspergillus alliaceus]|uniref:DUF4246 domain-containing protein n=1 Tax=Petromyces alliaceus TaxID=209559 RepID=A0A8H6A1X3_PETAA|nr:hypothetical protein ETB97_000501 [Aspergillus burnettii]
MWTKARETSDYTPDVGKPPQSIAPPLCIHSRLEERFRDPGLQVIFEVSRIDFTPKEPTCSREPDFHVEGFANEHIVATATHIIEAENITDVQFTFQHEDETHPSDTKGRTDGCSPTARARAYGIRMDGWVAHVLINSEVLMYETLKYADEVLAEGISEYDEHHDWC